MNHNRIGLMVGTKSIDYIRAIRVGVQNTLEEQGHTLIAISDLIPFHTRANAVSYFRVAFEVASRLDLDAIIVPAGIISGYLTDDHATLPEFLDILDPARTLVIEREVEGYRCLTKNNKPGMHACMRHLIEECGFKRIAWIGGPEASTGAREREEIFFEEMDAHDLIVPGSFVAHGDFSGECGGEIERLIDENPDLEAICCCCDLIAHSVYQVMRKRRLRVGADIAVTGFDDHAMSAHLDPPLSTVHMTGYDLGCMAVREAIRICEGRPQEEPQLSSTFIARGSCGEAQGDMRALFGSLLSESPLPTDRIIGTLVDSTLSMASRRIEREFSRAMERLFTQARAAYLAHVSGGGADSDMLFSSQDLTLLFNQPYRDRLSPEGFQSAAIALLQALVDVMGDRDAGWLIEQASNLHHGIARMLNAEVESTRESMSIREWVALHVTDDVMRESTNPSRAYELILRDFQELGVRQADLYLLPESVSFMGARTFALSDELVPVGRLRHGRTQVFDDHASHVFLQQVLDRLIPRRGGANAYTVGPIMAGDELLGIACLDAGSLDDDGQLIALLNLGIALKHMQMIANERESNEILSRSNLLLERQSHYDEMTGILNRRGFMSRLGRTVSLHRGELGCLFYLDLDGLKFINDTHGHDAGDEAIRQTTRVLGACLPPDTLLGRLGGDEFVAFCLVKDEVAVELLGSYIDAGMATFNATHSYPFDLSISYGGVLLEIGDATYAGINDTMVAADDRLYEMKKRRGTSRSFIGR